MQNIVNYWKSQSEITRKTGFLLMIAAAWILTPALGFLLLLFHSVRREVADIFRQALSSDFNFIWIPMVIPLAIFAYAHPVPVDDLLKHLVSGVYHYQYKSMFWGSPRLRNGDFYVGFDHVASWVYSLLPHDLAYMPFQFALVAGFSIILPLIFIRQMPDLPPYMAISLSVILTVSVWLLPSFTGRLISGRPEDDLALWSSCVFLLSGKRKYNALWFLFGLASVPMYWLSCVYFPLVFLMPARLRTRILAFFVLCTAFILFWGFYSHWHWLSWLISLHTDIGDRAVGVAEDISAVPIVQSISGSFFMAMACVAVLFEQRAKPAKDRSWSGFFSSIFHHPEKIPLIAILFAWMLIPDMIRYVDILGPLAGVMMAKWLNDLPVLRSAQFPFRAPTVLVALISATLLVGYTFHPDAMPDVHIPGYKPGQKVLTYFSAATYDTLYENPGVMVAPAMELGMTRHVIQVASFDLGKGDFHCRELHKWGVRWAVTPKTAFPTKQASCAHLFRLNKNGMSLWSISR